MTFNLSNHVDGRDHSALILWLLGMNMRVQATGLTEQSVTHRSCDFNMLFSTNMSLGLHKDRRLDKSEMFLATNFLVY